MVVKAEQEISFIVFDSLVKQDSMFFAVSLLKWHALIEQMNRCQNLEIDVEI